MHTEPLVSAIMPTRGRCGWASDAVRMFAAQTYARKELVIIDDRQERSFPHGWAPPADVRYFVENRLTIGAKRNIAVSRAAGEVIVHWDSDDTYSPDRIARQIELLLSSDAELVGHHSMVFEDVDRREKWLCQCSPGRPIGVSFCYWREIWEQRPFAAAMISGEDGDFHQGRKLVTVDGDGSIVARIHNANTSEKRTPIAQNPEQWMRL